MPRENQTFRIIGTPDSGLPTGLESSLEGVHFYEESLLEMLFAAQICGSPLLGPEPLSIHPRIDASHLGGSWGELLEKLVESISQAISHVRPRAREIAGLTALSESYDAGNRPPRPRLCFQQKEHSSFSSDEPIRGTALAKPVSMGQVGKHGSVEMSIDTAYQHVRHLPLSEQLYRLAHCDKATSAPLLDDATAHQIDFNA
jgi:hypothetical protein